MTEYLSRDAILSADDLPTSDVEVPEWGGTVRVRALDGTSRDAYDASLYDLRSDKLKRTPDNMRAKLVALSVVDGEGALLFTVDDVIRLGRKSAAALQRVWDEARRLSALSEAEAEELEQSFGSAPSEVSSSV